MTDPIVKLDASDFKEAVAHLSLVFGDSDFASLLPALYQPTDEHMRRNLAVRRNGKIAAIVGVFPIDWIVGATHLRLAGIGGVSVHPDFRGQGLMRLLMGAAMAEIESGGYHAACLGGNRRRYGYWGFEKAGVEASFQLTPNSIEHSKLAPPAASERRYIVRDAQPEDASRMQALYERLPIRCARSADSFERHLHNWRRKPVVVQSANGNIRGYACIDPNDRSCVDCSFADSEALDAFVVDHVSASGRPARIFMPLLRDQIFSRLESLADDVSLAEASNWRIYDWPAVLSALLNAKHLSSPLAKGTCTLRVRHSATSDTASTCQPITFRISIDQTATCTPCDDAPDFETDASTLLRTLSSPLSPPFPPRASILAHWCPLPLMIPMQDRI